jgi:hypothetical protein
MDINLHIERLVLDGVGIQPQQAHALKAVVESALRQQLVSQGVGSGMRSEASSPSVRGGSVSIQIGQGTGSLGQQIGHAVYRGIGK